MASSLLRNPTLSSPSPSKINTPSFPAFSSRPSPVSFRFPSQLSRLHPHQISPPLVFPLRCFSNRIFDPNYVGALDTTLPDGEQSPGSYSHLQRKARHTKLDVNIIKVGFPTVFSFVWWSEICAKCVTKLKCRLHNS